MYVIVETQLLKKTKEEWYLTKIDYKKRILTYNKEWTEALTFNSRSEALKAVDAFEIFKPFTVKYYK